MEEKKWMLQRSSYILSLLCDKRFLLQGFSMYGNSREMDATKLLSFAKADVKNKEKCSGVFPKFVQKVASKSNLRVVNSNVRWIKNRTECPE